MKKAQQRYFENANKPGRFLASLIKHRQKKKLVTKLVVNNEEVTDPLKIKSAFEVFYASLYKQAKVDKDKMENYLESIGVTKINSEMINNFNAPISEEEVETAINKLKNSKALGLDGYTARFYKCIKKHISGKLARVMNKVLESQEIPSSWREANITLIPKDLVELNNPKNYRPISLLNLDYKIFAAFMAERLKEVLQNYIVKEQAGFLPGGHITDNILNLLNMIEYYDKKT